MWFLNTGVSLVIFAVWSLRAIDGKGIPELSCLQTFHFCIGGSKGGLAFKLLRGQGDDIKRIKTF
jgi:hypothetical protein